MTWHPAPIHFFVLEAHGCDHSKQVVSMPVDSTKKESSINEVQRKGEGEILKRRYLSSIRVDQAGLPDRIKYPKKFHHSSDLIEELENSGLSDLQVVLNNYGHVVWRKMPSDKHRACVRKISKKFERWKGDLAIKCEKESNVYVNESGKKDHYLCPDIGLFGSTRLYDDVDIKSFNNKTANPQVIIDAVDEMMINAGKGDYLQHGRPNVAILIMALRRGKQKDSPCYGFDVYEVRQDQQCGTDPTQVYRVGSSEDCTIEIDVDDMGIAEEDTSEKENFTIVVQELRELLESH